MTSRRVLRADLPRGSKASPLRLKRFQRVMPQLVRVPLARLCRLNDPLGKHVSRPLFVNRAQFAPNLCPCCIECVLEHRKQFRGKFGLVGCEGHAAA